MSDRYDREFHTAHLYVPGPLGDATLPCMGRPMTALPLRDFTDAERAAGIPLLFATTWPPRLTHAIARLLGWTAALKLFCPCGTCGEGR